MRLKPTDYRLLSERKGHLHPPNVISWTFFFAYPKLDHSKVTKDTDFFHQPPGRSFPEKELPNTSFKIPGLDLLSGMAFPRAFSSGEKYSK